MDWIHNYQLFLFDFDGILVNSEELHYRAYKKVCLERGFSLQWDLNTYFRHAMYSATGLQEGIYREFPDLKRAESDWAILYQEKKKAYYDLLNTEGVSLMPGVQELLSELESVGIKRCVVTHSLEAQVSFIRKKNPILNSIPFWVTRECYTEPKPSSECYKKAIALYAEDRDSIIGFEDSPRGLQALLGTRAKAMFVTEFFHNNEIVELSQRLGKEFSHVNSLHSIVG